MSALRFTRRHRSLAAAVALVASLLVSSGVDAKPPSQCDIANSRLHARYVTLQAAVDAAGAGDSLRVKGTCVGNTAVNKDLTILGQPRATLDGNNAGSVVTIGARVLGLFPTVTMSDLTITHGNAAAGGGILLQGSLTLLRSTVTGNVAAGEGGGILVDDNGSGVLTLDQGSVVAGNTASGGGGIASDHGGPIYLNGSSSVHHNFATDGGGIEVGEAAGVVLNDTSSVHDNSATGYGGGIAALSLDTVALNDSSSIYGNAADRGGGLFDAGLADISINDNATIHDNSAMSSGGGVYARQGGVGLTGFVAGVDVLHNSPDDIFLEP
jgi:predicted outer membrane repeat protein